MRPQLVETLYRISLLLDPDPEKVFQQIAQAIAELYGETMAMVNLLEEDCLRCRTIINPHPAFRQGATLSLQKTLCQFPMDSARPLLIQNAKEHPDFCRHIVVKLKLNRYLGVPICRSDGTLVGTLCFLDNQTEEMLGEEDIQFLSLLAMRVSAELEREQMIQDRVALLAKQAQELRQRNEQLDAMAREQRVIAQQLADVNARLQATAEEKRHFVNMVIHDLRHPLTTMRTTLHLLRLESSRQQRMEDLQALENRTNALATLLDELVLYDQIETGRSLLQISAIDVGRLLVDCVEEVAGHAGAQEVPVLCAVAPELGTVYLDARKLRHILLNLISNALKFTSQGHVTVRAHPENAEQWRLEVEDTGIGMTSRERERAFEEYFTGANREQGGIGLGLAIAHRLCTVMQAKVSLRSIPGKGTCFHLIFPRRLAPVTESKSNIDGRTDRIVPSGMEVVIPAP